MDFGSLDPCVGSRQISITHITGIASIVYHILVESQNREIVKIVDIRARYPLPVEGLLFRMPTVYAWPLRILRVS